MCLHLAKWAAEQVDAKIAPVRRRRRLQISLFASSAAASWVDAMSESASLGAVAQAHPNHFEWFRSGARTRKGLLIQLAIVCGVRKRVDGRERASAFSLCVCVCVCWLFLVNFAPGERASNRVSSTALVQQVRGSLFNELGAIWLRALFSMLSIESLDSALARARARASEWIEIN